jgi:hypothetical protein
MDPEVKATHMYYYDMISKEITDQMGTTFYFCVSGINSYVRDGIGEYTS